MAVGSSTYYTGWRPVIAEYQLSPTLFTNALSMIYFPGDHKLNCIGSLLIKRLMFMTAYIVFLLNLIIKSSSVKESVFHFFTTCKLRILSSLDKMIKCTDV